MDIFGTLGWNLWFFFCQRISLQSMNDRQFWQSANHRRVADCRQICLTNYRRNCQNRLRMTRPRTWRTLVQGLVLVAISRCLSHALIQTCSDTDSEDEHFLWHASRSSRCVAMVQYGFRLGQDEATWLRIISKPSLTPKMFYKCPKRFQGFPPKDARGGAYNIISAKSGTRVQLSDNHHSNNSQWFLQPQ